MRPVRPPPFCSQSPARHLSVARGCAAIRSRAPAPSFGPRLRRSHHLSCRQELVPAKLYHNSHPPRDRRFVLHHKQDGQTLPSAPGAVRDAPGLAADTAQVRSPVLGGRGKLGLGTTTPRPGCLRLLVAAFVGQVEEAPSWYMEWRHHCVAELLSWYLPRSPYSVLSKLGSSSTEFRRSPPQTPMPQRRHSGSERGEGRPG